MIKRNLIFAIAFPFIVMAFPRSLPAEPDTTWFGGTHWDSADQRWEAMADSVWTFDSGVGSSFDHSLPYVDPYKNLSLHALMEGWIGFNLNQYDQGFFRRLSEAAFVGGSICVGDAAGLGGDWSLFAGVTSAEADSLCYATGQGYGDLWTTALERQFQYAGTGNVILEFDYRVETEPGFDYAHALVDTSCADPSPLDNDPYTAGTWTGSTSGHFSHVLTPGAGLPSQAGGIRVVFVVSSDGIYSDEDGVFPTTCGALAVDNVSVQGGGIGYFNDFESTDSGWIASSPQSPWGEWSHLRAVADLPPPEIACPGLGDSVLVFEDISFPNETYNWRQHNIAVSPWIDLTEAGQVGRPIKLVDLSGYFYAPVICYHCMTAFAQWYPDTCALSGVVRESELTPLLSFTCRRFFGDSAACFTRNNPIRLDVSDIVPPGAERVRVAVGIQSICPAGLCGEFQCQSAHWFNDVRFGAAEAGEVVAVPGDVFALGSPSLTVSPNPLRAREGLSISVAVPYAQAVTLHVYDLTGRLVGTVFEGTVEKGPNTVRWNGRSDSGEFAPSGIYFLRMHTEEGKSTQKFLILRN